MKHDLWDEKDDLGKWTRVYVKGGEIDIGKIHLRSRIQYSSGRLVMLDQSMNRIFDGE